MFDCDLSGFKGKRFIRNLASLRGTETQHVDMWPSHDQLKSFQHTCFRLTGNLLISKSINSSRPNLTLKGTQMLKPVTYSVSGISTELILILFIKEAVTKRPFKVTELFFNTSPSVSTVSTAALSPNVHL